MSLISFVSKCIVEEEDDDLPDTGATAASIINSKEAVAAKNLIILNAVITQAKGCSCYRKHMNLKNLFFTFKKKVIYIF